MGRFLLVTGAVIGSWALAFAQDKSKTIVTMTEPPPPAVEYNSRAWKEFSSQEGRFSIMFPGAPVARASTMHTPIGDIPNHTFILKLPESYYHVNFIDFPAYADTDEFVTKVLEAGRKGMLANTPNMELVEEREIAANGLKGREYLTVLDKDAFGITRAFVFRGRLYEIGLLVPADVAFKTGRQSPLINDRTDFLNLLVSRFFDSFKLMENSTAENAEVVGEVDRMVAKLRSQKKEGVVAAPSDVANITDSVGILNGRARHLETPPYPAVARSARAAGRVSVKVLIDLEGKVAAAQIVEGHPLLRAAALKAARESKFSTTQLEGKAVIVVGVIVYNFVTQ